MKIEEFIVKMIHQADGNHDDSTPFFLKLINPDP